MTPVRLSVSVCLGSDLQRPGLLGPCGGVLEILTIWTAVEYHLGTRLACTGEELGSGSALQLLISVSVEESECSGAQPGERWGTPSLGCGND